MNSLATRVRTALKRIELSEVLREISKTWAVPRNHVQRHRRVVALTGSLLLHILFILALLSPSPKGLSAGGSNGVGNGPGSGEAYAAIDLYAVPSPAAISAVKIRTELAADRLDAPAAVAAPENPSVQAVTSDPQSLAPMVTATVASPAEVASIAQPAAAIAGAGQGGSTTGAGDDLWNAIAPCWKRVAAKDTLPVTLKITFAANGGLSTPPQIVRSDDIAITPQSLHSEALALAALAQCGAYPMAANRRDVEVNFPRPE